MRIRTKLLLLLLSLGFAATGVSNLIAYINARNDLTEAALRQLTSVRRTKAQEIESYFRLIRSHVLTLSEDRMLIDACAGFRSAFRRLDGPEPPAAMKQAVTEYYRTQYLPRLASLMPGTDGVEKYLPIGGGAHYLQYWYILKNPFPVEKKWSMNDASDGSEYSKAHARFHPSIRKIERQLGYEDMLLVDDETGRVIYTVEKNPDLGTNLKSGPYRTSALAGLFGRCLNAKGPDEVFLTDFETYAPDSGHPALFMASPIFDGPRRAGVLVVELSITELDRVVTGNRRWEADGLGKTGDTAIIASDYLVRSSLRTSIQEPQKHLDYMRRRNAPAEQIRRVEAFGTTVLQEEIRLAAIESALAGNEGTATTNWVDGRMLVSYGPLHIPGLKWALASGMDEAEALEPVAEMRGRLRLWTLVVLLMTALAALLLTNRILRTVNALVGAARQVGVGNLSATVPVESADELGMLSRTFNGMVRSIREMTEEIAQKNRENEALLLNILPEPIAARLKGGESRIADNFAEVTVLFADIVGFTELSGRSAPEEVVELLNGLFTRFDILAQRHGVEKIKTIGDAYMAVTGLPSAHPDHLRIMVNMALDMLDEVREHGRETGKDLRIRVGVNSGPVVAGVIGKSKFIYDLWGDTVNLASRMESNGVPGEVQVTRVVYEQLKDQFEFEARGAIEVKGKGRIEAWLVRRKYENIR